MDEVSITELRQQLPSYLGRVAKGATVVVTLHGKPIAKIGPIQDRRAEAARRIEAMRETARVGDLVSPIDADWKALG